jgi:hypothetical protein
MRQHSPDMECCATGVGGGVWENKVCMHLKLVR